MMKSFNNLCDGIARDLLTAPVVKNVKWQSTRVHQGTQELLNSSFTLYLDEEEDLTIYRALIDPNLPWADDHFEKERVSGEPINPGTTWREWPYALVADKHRREGEKDRQFDHSYAERYWPKYAGKTEGGYIDGDQDPLPCTGGIRFPYGDLEDLVNMLANEPTTRQAYLPVWFPEDLAAATIEKRVPCTLGYHFIMRDNQLHIIYPMRSCDFIRHFRDDVYLTLRLLLWVLERCRMINPEFWNNVAPGTFTMHITSLHIFESDKHYLAKKVQKKQ